MGNSDSKLSELKQANAKKLESLELAKSKAQKNVQAISKRISVEEAAAAAGAANGSSDVLESLKESLNTEQNFLSEAEKALVDFRESSKLTEATLVSDLTVIEHQFMDELNRFRDSSLRGLNDKVARKVEMEFCEAQEYIKVPINAIYSAKSVKEYVGKIVQSSIGGACTKVATSLDFINIALIGGQKAWKQALANHVFGQDTQILTIDGVPVDKEFVVRQSEKCKHLRLYCTKALSSEYSVINALTEAQEAAVKEDTPSSIHAVWYCLSASESLSEDGHSDSIKKLASFLSKINVPLFIVSTRAKSMDYVPQDLHKCGLSDIPTIAVTTGDDGNEKNCSLCIKRLIESTTDRICKSCSLSPPSTFISNTRKNFKNAISDNLEEIKRAIKSEERRNSAAKSVKSFAGSDTKKYKSGAVSVFVAEIMAALGGGHKSDLNMLMSGHLNVMVSNIIKWAEGQIESVFSEITSAPLDSTVARIEELLGKFKEKYNLTPNCPWDKEGIDLRRYILGHKNGFVKKSVETAFFTAMSDPLVEYFAEENAMAFDNSFSEELKERELDKAVDESVCSALKKIPNEHKKETSSGIWKLF